MAYIAPIHRSTSVRYALQARLLSADEQSLVVAKSNRLEVWRLADNQLALVHSKSIFGNICMLQKLQPKDSPTEILFVGTDRFKYFTLAYNSETRQLETIQAVNDVGERFVRSAVTKNECLVDPTGRYVVMLLWSGVLNALRLLSRKGVTTKLEELGQARISELYIKAAAFHHTETGHPLLALLYQPDPDLPLSKLVNYRLCSNDANTELSQFNPNRDRISTIEIKDAGARMLIPVERVEAEKRHNFRHQAGARAHLGGIIVVGESSLLYVDDVSNVQVEAPLPSANIFVAWAMYDNTHYFLADEYGGMHLLTIFVDQDANNAVTSLDITAIGKTSRASVLVLMEREMDDSAKFLFVGSHYGNSQLLRVNLFSSPILEVVQTIPNIGPVLDFTVMDMGNRFGDSSELGNAYSSGQARIVTGSGAHKDGSLRSVRSGVGLEDVAVVGEIPGVRGLFPIRSYGSSVLDTLVVSFVTETRVFKFDAGGEVEELETFDGLDLIRRTLLVTNLPGGHLLSVTESNASIIDLEDNTTLHFWAPKAGESITAASANDKWLLLAVDGRTLMSLSLEQELRPSAKRLCGNDQVSCLHVSPHLSDVGVLGFWTSGTIAIVKIETLSTLHAEDMRRQTDDAAMVPRDIVLARVHPADVAGPTLFVSMDDGEVVNFTVQKDHSLSTRRSVVLGTRHALFYVLPQPGGVCNIFVTSEHSSLIYGSEGRIVFSAVTAESATCVCPFDTPGYPDSLVVATEQQLKICRVDKQRQSHIQELPMGETVRCIAYSRDQKLFGIGCVKRDFAKGVEKASSTFKLVDEVIFRPLGEPFHLEEGELVECVIRARLPDAFGNMAERFVVGTRSLPTSRGTLSNDSTGRVLVFGVDEDRSPYLIMDHHAKSGCRRIAVLEEEESQKGNEKGKNKSNNNDDNNNLLIVVLTKTIVLVRYVETSWTTGKLIRLASYQTCSYAVDAAVNSSKGMIGVADLMKSVALVKYVPAVEVYEAAVAGRPERPERLPRPATLVEVARHYSSAWATAVCCLPRSGDKGGKYDNDDNDDNDGGSIGIYFVGDSGHAMIDIDVNRRNQWLEADADGNLMVLSEDMGGSASSSSGARATGGRRLKVTSEMGLGETVNRIQPIRVDPGPNAPILPQAFLGTVEGSIYMFGTIARSYKNLLLTFQAQLEKHVENVGDIPFGQWRAYQSAEREADGPVNFLDGEMLERFLDMDEDTQAAVCEGLGPSVESMRSLVEELKSMH